MSLPPRSSTLPNFLLILALGTTIACGGDAPDDRVAAAPETLREIASRGEATPHEGYTLFNPLRSTSVYLVDMQGELVHRWKTEYNTGQSVYLLENGNLLKSVDDPEPEGVFRGGGEGGIVQEIAPDGTVVWEFKFSDESKRHHHDIEPMPNGNVLLIAWEGKTYEEAVAAGINPSRMEDDDIWPDFVVEIEPVYPDGGNVVWEWHVWDHLVQELYRDKDNYGVVADHPELIDINAAPAHREQQQMAAPETVESLRGLGYIAGSAATDNRPEIGNDWLHSNSIDYNAELDQILISVRHFSEIWVIDHSTTTEEAAGHEGGRYGKGGDLLYRWGNPEAHGVGDPEDRQLFVQHDARWIPEGYPGAGNITVLNNGGGRPEPHWSSVDEIVPPMNPDGSYVMEPGEPTGPAAPVWTYTAPEPSDFYASFISGAHRLPNGNTIVGDGAGARMFEVGADNAVVWEMDNPFLEDEGPQAEQREQRAAERRAEQEAEQQAGESGGEPAEEPGEGPQEAAEGRRRGEGRGDGERGGRDGQARGGEGRRGGRGGDGGDRGGEGGGRGGGGRGPTPGTFYRATRISPDHPGLAIVLAVANGGDIDSPAPRRDD